MKLVVQVKLLPSADQAGALQTTLHAANAAANRVSRVAYDKKVFRNFALRQHTYQDIRAAGLGSQAAQHVIKKAAGAYRALHSNIKNGRRAHVESRDQQVPAPPARAAQEAPGEADQIGETSTETAAAQRTAPRS